MYGTYLFIKEPSESEWITVYVSSVFGKMGKLYQHC